MSWYEKGPFTIFDVETTGRSPVYDRIVEIAALRIEKDGTESRFSTLINPGRRIPYSSMRIHHITDAMVMTAPRFEDIAQDFMTFISGSILVAHNARFDLGFLQESLARCGMMIWEGDTMDSVRLARGVFPGLPSYKLQELRITLDLGCNTGTAHRAGCDVEWTAVLLRKALTVLIEAENKRK
ncbi:MAG: 3'-5' exonuclease [Lentisphaerae bacterium]|nr:3'-5' exonuclease [Lentisphaerota bacterium]